MDIVRRNRKPNPFKWDIGDIVAWGERARYKILDKKVERVKDLHNVKKYYCECMNCGRRQWYEESYFVGHIHDGKCGTGCRSCGRKGGPDYAKLGRTISQTAKWMIPLLKDPKDAHKYTPKSHKKIWFVCPQCHNEILTEPALVSVEGKVACPRCSDGFSIPNKFGLSVLRQTDAENLENEYSPEWIDYRRYDFSFWKDGKHYIVEFDGGLHYEEAFNKTADEIQAIDDEKQRIAEQHGCEVIRIPSLKSNIDYLRKQTEESELASILDLSNVDWEKVKKDCLTSNVIKACELYNGGKGVSEIADLLGFSVATAIHSLEYGRDIGMCDYKTKFEIYKEKFQRFVELKNTYPFMPKKWFKEQISVCESSYNRMNIEARKKHLLLDPRSEVEKKKDSTYMNIIKIKERKKNA